MTWHTAVIQPCQLGESPFWHPQEGLLYYVDIPARQVLRIDPLRDRLPQAWDMPSEPGCIAPVRGGGLVIALRDRIVRARTWGGPLQELVRFAHDPRTTRFNDGKCDSAGRLWAGSMYEPRDQWRAELYCIDMRSGTPVTTLKAVNAVTANGIVWSPDDRTAWWSDTPRHRIHCWDYESGPAVLRRHRVFAQFASKPLGWDYGDVDAGARYRGRPDGSAVNAAGHYLCAMYEGGRVLRFAADGTLLQDLPLPVACPTMPCFGGADLKTLFVTTARQGRSDTELQCTPLAGCVLATQVELPGLPVHFFDAGDGG